MTHAAIPRGRSETRFLTSSIARARTLLEIRSVLDAPVHPRRVTHAVLLTTNLERLARFYREVGGLEEAHRDEGVVFLRGSLSRYAYHLVLCRKGEEDERRYHHVSFELESENAFDRAFSALSSRGVEVVDSDLKRSFFLRDPDGLLSEYYVRRGPGFPDLESVPEEARPLHA